MNNSVFGKTLENVRNRRNVQLVSSGERVRKLCAKPHFLDFRIFNTNLAAIHLLKVSLALLRPTYVGFTILDISKIFMYDYHYNHIKSTYQSDLQWLFTDTDSLVYEIQTHDLYQNMKIIPDFYDFSAYPQNRFCYNISNKKIIGKFKDEFSRIVQREFVGLRFKMYSIADGDSAKKTAKWTD